MKQTQQYEDCDDDDDDDDDDVHVADDSCTGSGSGWVLWIRHSASPPPLFQCCAKLAPVIAVFLWAKSNTTFLAANYLRDEIKRWDTLLHFHVHPPLPHHDLLQGKNKSTSLFFPWLARTVWLDTALYKLLFLSLGPKKTQKPINQCQDLTPSSRGATPWCYSDPLLSGREARCTGSCIFSGMSITFFKRGFYFSLTNDKVELLMTVFTPFYLHRWKLSHWRVMRVTVSLFLNVSVFAHPCYNAAKTLQT